MQLSHDDNVFFTPSTVLNASLPSTRLRSSMLYILLPFATMWKYPRRLRRLATATVWRYEYGRPPAARSGEMFVSVLRQCCGDHWPCGVSTGVEFHLYMGRPIVAECASCIWGYIRRGVVRCDRIDCNERQSIVSKAQLARVPSQVSYGKGLVCDLSSFQHLKQPRTKP